MAPTLTRREMPIPCQKQKNRIPEIEINLGIVVRVMIAYP